MCDYFLKRVEGDQQAGDLTDIVRAGGAMPAGSADPPSTSNEWLQLPTDPILFPPPQSSSDGAGPSGADGDAFGDPFSGLPDPFGTDYPSSSGSAAADFFDAIQNAMDVGMAKQVGFVGGGTPAGAGGGFLDMRNHHMFQRDMPISGLSPYALMGGGAAKLGVPMAGHGQTAGPCAFDSVAGLQMSPSPRGGGIKRRFGTGHR